MFETVDDLNRRLPKPRIAGDQKYDLLVIEQHISNAKALRSEAFACMIRAAARRLRKTWRQVSVSHMPERSHQA